MRGVTKTGSHFENRRSFFVRSGRTRVERWADRFRNFSPHTIALLFWTSLAFVFLALFFRMAFSVHPGGVVQSLDEQILRFIGGSMRSKGWDFFFVDLAGLGGLAVVSAISLTSIILFLLSGDPAAAIHLLIVAVGVFQIGGWSKSVVERARPDIIPKLIQVGGQAFPSGHAVTASAIYLTLAILACRHFRTHSTRVALFALAGFLIAGVSFSRVYVGVHYPSDVLGGACLGASWALFMGGLFSKKHFY